MKISTASFPGFHPEHKHETPVHRVRYPAILAAMILFILTGSRAQGQDTVPAQPESDSVLLKQHSPTKATIMSALLPGLGQAYNRKYWKIPIIYAGFGVMGYFIYTNAHEYKIYRGAYQEEIDGVADGKYADLVSRYTADDLYSAEEYYRRNLEISCLITTLWYALNIIDAVVDAHLFTYDISEDLALKIQPAAISPDHMLRAKPGISIALKF
jgi:hypothetical protein